MISAVGDRRRGHDHFVHRVLRELDVLASRLDHEHVAVFAREIQLAVAGNRRCRKRAAAAHARAIEQLAGRPRRTQSGCRCCSACRADRDRRSATRCRCRRDRDSTRSRRWTMSRRQRNVAARAGADGVDRAHRRIAGRDDREIAMNDRRADRDLGVRRQRPQQRAGAGIVAAHLRAVGHELIALRSGEDRRRRPRRDFVRSRACATARGRSPDRTPR